MNINLQGLLGALEKPKSNPVGKVSFHSDKVNENEIISEHDKRWNSLMVNHIASLSTGGPDVVCVTEWIY